jgi:hypothetical protein
MDAEDTMLCQQAIDLYNAGQKPEAYQRFSALYNKGNTEDITLLFWLAYSTPYFEEVQRTAQAITRLEPSHPKLPELRDRIVRWQQRLTSGMIGPTLTCPYCHHTGPSHVRRKTSTGGWVCLVVLLLLFYPLSWIGLLFKKDVFLCATCGIKLAVNKVTIEQVLMARPSNLREKVPITQKSG